MKAILLPTVAAGLWLAAGLPAAAQAPPAKTSATVTSAAAKPVASAPLAALFNTYSEEQARLFPLDGIFLGDNRYNDQLPNDQTHAFRQQLRQSYRQHLAALRKVNRAGLSADDRVSYDIFEYLLTDKLAELQQNSWLMPFAQFFSLPNTLPLLGAGTGAQPFKTVKDYDNWLGRAHGFPVWADSAIANFRAGMKAGVVLPKVLVLKTIPQLEALAVADPAKSLFYGPITKLPASFAEADKARLTAAYQQAIATDLAATYQKLATFLKTEYLPQARTTAGLSALPGGAQAYQYFVQTYTTTTKTPEEIYQTGLREVKRIQAEIGAVKTQVGFQGDLPAFFAYMRDEPKFRPFKTPQDVLAAYEAIHQRMAPNLSKLFGRTPKTPFEVRPVEAFRAASSSAQYSPGAPDGSRPGIFYVPILDATQYSTVAQPAMESLFLHEAIPGHHYQIALQLENKALPKFRQMSQYSAYMEGWGLYTESLGKELGLYTDPYQYAGALGGELHRAIRLVVDVGLHTKGMTREQAIQYMMANELISEQGATAEVERYMAMPGQALSYKIGQLKLRELRAKYEKQLGKKFNLKAFHDELLAGGAMPLAVLERKMDAWATRIK
ncbi:DUF885 domain-containing protein [Hymenobacter setariae]|uniref:DUF885 domain-containing protein n=1 Tax=Hymenobacter setariae TaxID=2594794 RepID=A0A558BPY1_9BACT|nr:DUF885 domain-containing protein [Hymenobacter setariae]TVT38561.1 DUF885 domain-containing protein [Hymenobacter setariae]